MFGSIYSSVVTAKEFFIMAAVSLAVGFFYAWVMSFRIRSTKRFFIVAAIVPFIVAAVITFVNGNIGAGVAIGGAFSLIRFRSAQGSADEIAAILIAMGAGIAFGMGFLAYGVLILVVLSLLFYVYSMMPVFEHRSLTKDRLLRITIPEALEYNDVFRDIFDRYLKECESVGVKTTGMGSMFRLSFRVQMKDPDEEKAFIDELRTRNGNLEIAVTPYVDMREQL